MRNNGPFLQNKKHKYTQNSDREKNSFSAEFPAIIIWHFALLMYTFALTQGKEVINTELTAVATEILAQDKNWEGRVNKGWAEN